MKAQFNTGRLYLEGTKKEEVKMEAILVELSKSGYFQDTDCRDDDGEYFGISIFMDCTIKDAKDYYRCAKREALRLL